MSPMKLPRTTHRRLNQLAIVFVVAVVVWFGGSYLVAYRLVHRAQPRMVEAIPTIAWGEIEPVVLSTSDGEQLGAWFIEGATDQPIVLLLHGNGGRKASCLSQAEHVAARGCG